MKLNRRQFFKLTGAVIASVSVPSIGEARKYPNFDPNKTYGDFACLTDWNDEGVRIAKIHLVEQIRTFIPPEYCNKRNIKFIYKTPVSFGNVSADVYERGTVGWKYTPEAKS